MRTIATLPVILALTVFLRAMPLAAQPSETSQSHETTTQFYSPSVTPAVYLINFIFNGGPGPC